MCKAASFIVTQNRVLWLMESDSHADIIDHYREQYHLEDTDTPNFVRVELSPPGHCLVVPTKQWRFRVEQFHRPEWFDAHEVEVAVRKELKNWIVKLRGVRLKEAYNPTNPLTIEPHKYSQATLLRYLQLWVSVRATTVLDRCVGATVGAAVGDTGPLQGKACG